MDGVVRRHSPEKKGTKLGVALGSLVRSGVDATFEVEVDAFAGLFAVESQPKLSPEDLEVVCHMRHNGVKSWGEGQVIEGNTGLVEGLKRVEIVRARTSDREAVLDNLVEARQAPDVGGELRRCPL